MNEPATTEIVLDLASVRSENELHLLFAETLSFPDFYGGNWDAFWDVLTGFGCFPSRLVLLGREDLKEHLPRAVVQLDQCFKDCQKSDPQNAPEIIWQ